MTELLLAALDRLPRRVRRFVVAAGALLALGAVMAALIMSAPRGGLKHRPTPRQVAAGSSRTPPRRLPPPVPAAAMRDARRVAERFLTGYLPFAYGRGSALAVGDVTSTLRRQLRRERARLTPVELRRARAWCRCRRSARRRRSWSRWRSSTTAGWPRTACGSRSRPGRGGGR